MNDDGGIYKRLNEHQGRLSAVEAKVDMIEKLLVGVNRRLEALIVLALTGVGGLLVRYLAGG